MKYLMIFLLCFCGMLQAHPEICKEIYHKIVEAEDDNKEEILNHQDTPYKLWYYIGKAHAYSECRYILLPLLD